MRARYRITLQIAAVVLVLAALLPPCPPAANAAGLTTPSEVAARLIPTQQPPPTPDPALPTIKIQVGGDPDDPRPRPRHESATVVTSTVTATPTSSPSAPDAPAPAAATPITDEAAYAAAPLPVLSRGLTSAELAHPCGYGLVGAADGHELRATPELPLNGSNRVALLPEGAKVTLIDCAVWIDGDLLPWVTVQTASGKFGWMLVQPDKFYVQVLPVAFAPQRITSVPAGATVGYAPPAECEEKDTSAQGQITSLGVDFVPVVGDVKGLQEAATGCDAITGEPLGDWRWLGLLGIVGLAELKVLGHADEAADIARHADDVGDLADVTGDVARHGDEAVDAAGDVVRQGDEVAAAAAKQSDEVTDVARQGDDVSDVERNADEVAGAGKQGDEAGSAAGRTADEAASARRNADEAGDVARGADAAHAAGTIGEATYDAGKLTAGGDNSYAVAELTRRGYTADEAAYILGKFEQPCSFAATTLVLTAAGYVPIVQIAPGDQVLAYDEASRATGYYPVTAAFAHVDAVTLQVTIGHEQVDTTPDHPFFTSQGWVRAGDLQPGDHVLTAHGVPGAVTAIRRLYQPQVMYNLTVAQAHTYSVGAGTWLVHNACGKYLRANIDKSEYAKVFEENHMEWQAHHVIPKQYEDHRFLVEYTPHWKFDGSDNGIALPVKEDQAKQLCRVSANKYCFPLHIGSHHNYSETVDEQLDLLYADAKQGKWNEAQATTELKKLIEKLKTDNIKTLPTGSRLN